MIEHHHGSFTHRIDPVLVARVVAMKRSSLGEFAPVAIEARRAETRSGSVHESAGLKGTGQTGSETPA